MSNTFFPKMVSVNLGSSYCNTVAPSPIITAQTLVPHDVTSARWQRPFGFTFVRWEEVEMRRPSLYTGYGSTTLKHHSSDRGEQEGGRLCLSYSFLDNGFNAQICGLLNKRGGKRLAIFIYSSSDISLWKHFPEMA